MKQSMLLCLATCLVAGAAFAADDEFATLRGRAIAGEGTPPPMAKVENKDQRRKRNYPMQPPTIPHKIDNYQVITPTAWNIGPRDANGTMGPMEQAICGSPIENPDDPVEIGHVVRSYDSCLVCTVHAYDAKTDRELARFKVGGAC